MTATCHGPVRHLWHHWGCRRNAAIRVLPDGGRCRTPGRWCVSRDHGSEVPRQLFVLTKSLVICSERGLECVRYINQYVNNTQIYTKQSLGSSKASSV